MHIQTYPMHSNVHTSRLYLYSNHGNRPNQYTHIYHPVCPVYTYCTNDETHKTYTHTRLFPDFLSLNHTTPGGEKEYCLHKTHHVTESPMDNYMDNYTVTLSTDTS